jgi:mono/diheme cytochrome c family protein
MIFNSSEQDICSKKTNYTTTMKTRVILAGIFLLTTLTTIAGSPAEDGKAIFTTRCSGCHNVHKIVVGPALGGVDQRRPIEWIMNFVHSSQTVIKNGDPYAVALFNKFNHVQMPDHPDLTADNIRNIVEYIKVENKAGAGKPALVQVEKPGMIYMILTAWNYWFLITCLGLIALLIAAILFFVQIKKYERNLNRER